MYPNINMEDVPCPLGCKRDDELVLEGKDLLYDLPGTFKVVRCRNCGLMRTNPRPDPETIGHYYPDNYGPYLGTKVHERGKPDRNFCSRFLRKIARKAINFNTTCIPNMRPGKLLEIGCASGAYLYRMAQQGWQAEGIEFSPVAAKEAQKLGFKVFTGQVEKAPAPEEPYDLIVGWMVLEHLHDPVLALRKLRTWIKPDGWLVISVPNAGSFEFEIFKNKWYALQLPCHLFHFTPKSIEKILFEGGFELKKIYHQRILTNVLASSGYVLEEWGLESIGKKLTKLPEKASLLNYLLFPAAFILGALGQTGRMTIWARPGTRK